MAREFSRRVVPGIYYGRNPNGWLMLIRLGKYGLNLGTGFTGSVSLRSWLWARYDYADHFCLVSFDGWLVMPKGGN
jgi:hypothetical protein